MQATLRLQQLSVQVVAADLPGRAAARVATSRAPRSIVFLSIFNLLSVEPSWVERCTLAYAERRIPSLDASE
jgi:hypothetical protein